MTAPGWPLNRVTTTATRTGPERLYSSRTAAAYVGLTGSGLRSAKARGHIVPDGRRANTFVYRQSTLDAYLKLRQKPVTESLEQAVESGGESPGIISTMYERVFGKAAKQ